MQHIVVGVDGSRASRRALDWALEHARLCGATVEVIHAWTVPEMGGDPLIRALADPEELEAQARRELELVVDGADEQGLAAAVEHRLVCDEPVSALLEAIKDADLLVVGSRGLGDAGAALGSVTHGVISEAPCPVVVVPPDGAAA